MSMENVGDNEVLTVLLNPLRRKISQVSADGAYDMRACHQVIKKKNAVATIPPRKNAGYWEDGHVRNSAVKALKSGDLVRWKADVGYHKRSLSETAMYRYKTLIGNRLSLRCHDAQAAEMLAGVKALNKMLSLGMPVLREIKKFEK